MEQLFSILDILHPTCSFFSTSKDLRAQRNIDGAHSGCKTTIRINVVCWKCNKPGRWIGSQCYRMLSKVAPFNYSIILISYCVCVCVCTFTFHLFRLLPAPKYFYSNELQVHNKLFSNIEDGDFRSSLRFVK